MQHQSSWVKLFQKAKFYTLNDQLFRKSTVLFCSMMAGSLFGYFFQLLMGRMLTIKEFGEMNALMSLMVIFGIPFQTLIVFFAKTTAVYALKDELGRIRTLQKEGVKKLMLIIIPTLVVLFLVSGFIADFLHVSVLKVMIIYGCFFWTAVVTLNTGVIQGLQCFYSLAIIDSGIHVIRFLVGALLVWIGLGIYGALGSIFMAGFLLFLFSQWRILNKLPKEGQPLEIQFRDVYKYAGGLFLANALFGIMTQIDVMLVKHFFSAVDAGFYTSAAVLGKAVMYLPGAIVMVMFPMVASTHESGASSFGVLCKALLFTFILSGTGALILYFFSDFIVSLLYGTRYMGASGPCSIFGMAMLPVALTFLLMNYLLAQGDTKFVFVMAGVVFTEVCAIYLFHETLSEILYVVMASGTTMFCILLYKILSANYSGRLSKVKG